MKILITGDVNWSDGDYIRKLLNSLSREYIIICGGLKGVETWVKLYAELMEFDIQFNDIYDFDFDNRLYLICKENIPNKIIIVDNDYTEDKYKCLKFMDTRYIEIISVKSIMYF